MKLYVNTLCGSLVLVVCFGLTGCATGRSALSGCYLYDLRDYAKQGGGYYNFISRDAAPLTKVTVEQEGRTLTMRYQVLKDDELKEHVTHHKMHRKFPWRSARLVSRSTASLDDFMVMGNSFTKQEIHKNDNGDLVFYKRVRSLTCTCLGDMRLGKYTFTSILPHLDCSTPPVYRAQPVTSGVIAKHVDLHNESDVIMLDYNIRLDPPYSISTWVFLRSTEGPPSGTILSRGQGGPRYLDYELAVRDGRLAFTTSSGKLVGLSLEAEAPFPLDRWVHVAVTHKGETAKLYQDGKLVAVLTSLGSGDTLRRAPTVVGARFHHGRWGQVFDSIWLGSIADLTVHERVLTPTDIEELVLKGNHEVSAERKSTASAGSREINGVKYTGDSIISFFKPSKVRWGELAEDQVIDGHEYLAHSVVVFYKNGQVASGTLATDQTIDEIQFPRGSDVHFLKTGKIDMSKLELPLMIQDIPCAVEVEFHYSGKRSNRVRSKVRHTILAEEYTIHGITLLPGTPVEFFESGKLRRGIPKSDLEIDGITYAGGNMVKWAESGEPWHGTLKSDTVSQGITYAGSNMVEYFNGRIRVGVLAQETTIQNIALPARSTVGFSKTGRLSGVKIAEPTRIHGTTLPAGSRIDFYESGAIELLKLPETREFQGITCAAGTHISFYESGMLKDAYIKKAHKIHGVKVDGDRYIELLKSGHLRPDED